MHKPRIYLAGKASLTKFRKDTIKKYSDEFQFINPITAIDHSMPCDLIVNMDLSLISNSDFILAYMEEYSAGTCMEIFYARKIKNIPVVIVCNDIKFEHDIWLSGLGCEYCDSIDGAIGIIDSLLV